MPIPRVCPNPICFNHADPSPRWRAPYGSYETQAHGTVRRFRCRHCGTTVSTQTESIHLYAKRRLPIRAISASLLSGSSMREVARRYSVSPMTIHNAVLRLGRQSMAAQVLMLSQLDERTHVVMDGLRSCITSQDYPCDLTTVVDRKGATILSMSHAVFRRGGRMTATQRRRMGQKNRRWVPPAGTVRGAISQSVHEIWNILRPKWGQQGIIDTDENPMYRSVLSTDRIGMHYHRGGMIRHRVTPGSAPRTMENHLFPVNYIDRLMRHRMKEHTRETIAIGRNGTMQMHRAWIFAWDHNAFREYRVRRPEQGVHAVQGSVPAALIRRVNREFYRRRIRLDGVDVPRSIVQVWLGLVVTPPHRWKVGQRGTSVRIPAYARADLGIPAATRL